MHQTNVTSITIPEGVTNIGVQASWDCSNLTSATLPSSVSDIGIAAFAYCESLTSISIPTAVTSIAAETFAICRSLTTITIPYGLWSIRDSAFYACSSLPGITLPASVTNLGWSVFTDCHSLNGIYFEGNVPTVDSSAFSGDTNAIVYYLPGTTGWNATFAGVPTALWMLPNPLILNNGPGFGVKTNGFGFLISWATNIPVVVESSTRLANPVWSSLATNTLTGGSSYFSDPRWTNYPGRFYRLRSP